MPSYRRAHQPGGTFFFTIVTDGRQALFVEEPVRKLLHEAIARAATRRPFTIDAIVLLPEHLHLMMTLPSGDADYSTRIASFKAAFTRSFVEFSPERERTRSSFRRRTRRRGVWQPRFWEHVIRDADDYNNHFDYICYNPVKHGCALCPHAWPFSSFHSALDKRLYPIDWQCSCDGRSPVRPSFNSMPIDQMELE